MTKKSHHSYWACHRSISLSKSSWWSWQPSYLHPEKEKEDRRRRVPQSAPWWRDVYRFCWMSLKIRHIYRKRWISPNPLKSMYCCLVCRDDVKRIIKSWFSSWFDSMYLKISIRAISFVIKRITGKLYFKRNTTS